MRFWPRWFVFVLAVALPAGAQLSDRPGDWPSYYRDHRSWSYSPLDSINRSNARKLKVAWIHQPGTVSSGLQATPLAIDGVVYYNSSYNRIFAIDGATGKVLWHYYPYGASNAGYTIPGSVVWQPYTRGLAASHGRIYSALLDGRVIALDMKTGKLVWQTQVLDYRTCGCTFTAAPLAVKDRVIVGNVAGELPIMGQIFGLDAATGKVTWAFETIKKDSWGGDSWRYGGGGAWMTGSYDPELDLVYWGTGNPNPDFAPPGVRPGDNLYTSTIVALDPDDGKLVTYYQELPHDNWDFDAAIGEKLLIDRDGKKYLVHYSKSGYVFVYDRTNLTCLQVNPLVTNLNFVKGIECGKGSSKLIDPLIPPLWASALVCPWNIGAHSWNAGSYSPHTGLYYQLTMEACNRIWVQNEEPPDVGPPPQFRMGGDWQAVPPPTGEPYGLLVAFDPFAKSDPKTARIPVKWSVRFRIPPLGTVLSTAGDVVALTDYEGTFRVWDALDGKELYRFTTGSGSRGGVISYMANGKQYIVTTSGNGPQILDGYGVLWPDSLNAPLGAAVIAFTIEDGP